MRNAERGTWNDAGSGDRTGRSSNPVPHSAFRTPHSVEHRRLAEAREGRARWKAWGPYLADRAWGTVREDYSADGNAWNALPHDHARSKAYRWNEDGIAGISDDGGRLCFALALWNGRDPILKERFFGLTGHEGNHGEDVKEYYYYLDSTPTHSYMRMLYKYPQGAFPYNQLVEENRRRGPDQGEFELLDTGIFDDDRYFDVVVEYAKASPDDILVRIGATNRGPDAAELHLLPTLWFRNEWSWGDWHHLGHDAAPLPRPRIWHDQVGAGEQRVVAEHHEVGRYLLACERADALLFTENETNVARLYNAPNPQPYVKDGIGNAILHGRDDLVNPAGEGTKVAAHYRLTIGAGETATIRLRLRVGEPTPVAARRSEQGVQLNAPTGEGAASPFADFDALFAARQGEADEFYAALQGPDLSDDAKLVQRQAYAGMLWSKQRYNYDVETWLRGDPLQPPPPPERLDGRNSGWRHLLAGDVISMPDKWEYPWFASWDLAFHCIPLAMVDPDFAKEQLILLGREWYQHPNGQIPAYEWAFGDVNPPVLGWAAWRVYKIDQHQDGIGDTLFLERIFHKLMLNFTWWVNRKDTEGNNIFEGGFLGLDNIGVFDRSAPLPTGGHIEQSDGTSWMAMFCLDMLSISLELACHDRAYEDIAVKFFEHFLMIARAMNNMGGDGIPLWDDEDQFFYDVLHLAGRNEGMRLKIRSMVGIIPLFATMTIEPELLERLPEFRLHLEWVLKNRPDWAGLISRWHEPGKGDRRLIALVRGHRMKRVLKRMLDETEFLSPHGIRALSRYHADHPYVLEHGGTRYTVEYQPGESRSGMFGGNSNWRGPIWFPVNYLIVESLHEFHHYYSDDFLVEYPTNSGQYLNLHQIAIELTNRLTGLFLRDETGRRAIFGDSDRFQHDPHWRDLLPFHEYFHGDTGAGLGASHQTGWTGLIAKLIQQSSGDYEGVTGAGTEVRS